MAGGVFGVSNYTYYLYNGNYYWTMTPRVMGSSANVWYVINDGKLNSNRNVDESFGVRPVINLKIDAPFAGLGTIDNPYKLVS